MSIELACKAKVQPHPVADLRVVHLIPYMHPAAGGPPVVVDRWAAEMASMGCDVQVITTDGYAGRDRDWVRHYATHYPIHVGHKRGPSGFGFARGMRSKLIDVLPQTDLVHVHNLWGFANQLAGHYCPRFGVPYVISTHGMLDPHSLSRKSWKKRLYGRTREWPALRRAAGLIYTHDEEKRLAHQSLCPLPQGHVVPLGAEPSNLNRDDLADEFWDQYPQWRQRPMVLFLGRLHEKKGVELLLPALAKIPADRRPRLVLVGPGQTDYLRRLRAIVSRWQLEADVVFTGPLGGQAKHAAIAAADVFVLPSYQENFAITVVEAMHGGTPVIVSDRVNLHSDLLAHDAAVCCDLNAESIAQQIMTLLASPKRRQTLAENASRLAAQRYTWKMSGQRLLDVYRQVLGARC